MRAVVESFRTLFADLPRLLAEFPDLVGDRCDQIVMDLHEPHQTASTPVCARHRDLREWPCDDWTRAADSMAARRGR